MPAAGSEAAAFVRTILTPPNFEQVVGQISKDL
jgi:hypothetical protein